MAKLSTHCIRVRGSYGAPNRHGTPSIKIIDAGGFMTGQQATSWPSQKKYPKGFANTMAENDIQEQLEKIVEQHWDCRAILREVAGRCCLVAICKIEQPCAVKVFFLCGVWKCEGRGLLPSQKAFC